MKGQREITMTIAEEFVDEPPDEDGEFSFEIISDEEIASLSCPFTISMMSSSSSSSSISSQYSQGSCSSLGSTGNGPSTVIRARIPTKRCQSKNTGTTIATAAAATKNTNNRTALLTEEELTASARIWYLIQLKGHYCHEDDQLGTMEHSSMKRTGWLFNLLHLHEKLKQRNRFNINSIPEQAREQLKHLYVY